MPKQSAGILMFRRKGHNVEFFLVHPGGPFWAKKDDGAWSIPKGIYEEGEDPRDAAMREFEEETSCRLRGDLVELGSFKQASGKTIRCWAVEGDFDTAKFKSNVFFMEWPPKSGQMREFPEADRGAWFNPVKALQKILRGQRSILTALLERLALTSEPKE
jgi:predicted NUDIX family NTP pyrophosphohydrolase